MSTTTNIIRSVPDTNPGISVTTPALAWVHSQWKVIAPETNSDMILCSVQFQVTRVTTADTTYEVLIEVGFGIVGNPTTRVQLPYAFRSDTAVGIYLDAQVMLPEPVFIPKGTTVCVRYASNQISADTVNGIKLRVQNNTRPTMPEEAALPQNYKNVKVGSGMSATEITL